MCQIPYMLKYIMLFRMTPTGGSHLFSYLPALHHPVINSPWFVIHALRYAWHVVSFCLFFALALVSLLIRALGLLLHSHLSPKPRHYVFVMPRLHLPPVSLTT